MADRFELEVGAELENLSIISRFLAEVTERLGVSTEAGHEVQLAVDEACTNVIKYAYPEKKGQIRLACELAGSDLVITICDKGLPFDPRSVGSPDLSADLETRKVGGLGIYFMRRLMDRVDYEYDAATGNRLTMRKKVTTARR